MKDQKHTSLPCLKAMTVGKAVTYMKKGKEGTKKDPTLESVRRLTYQNSVWKGFDM